MARPIRLLPRNSSRRRLSVYIALGAFVAVDMLLIVLALGWPRVGAVVEAPSGMPKSDSLASGSTPTATPPSSLAGETVLPLPPSRLLSAVDENMAWRAATGACPATLASPELTTDGGATWKSTDATGLAKVTAVQRLVVTSESVVELVGLAESDCAPQFVKTFVAGDNYSSYPEQLAGTWFIDPADRGTIHSPAGIAKAPCETVVTLAVRDDRSAAALCADGRIFFTSDAAAWSVASPIPGVVNLTGTDTGYLAGAVGRAECSGVKVLMLTSALESTDAGCFLSASPPASLSGNVALSGADGTIWLWVNDALIRSIDSGANWK